MRKKLHKVRAKLPRPGWQPRIEMSCLQSIADHQAFGYFRATRIGVASCVIGSRATEVLPAEAISADTPPPRGKKKCGVLGYRSKMLHRQDASGGPKALEEKTFPHHSIAYKPDPIGG